MKHAVGDLFGDQFAHLVRIEAGLRNGDYGQFSTARGRTRDKDRVVDGALGALAPRLLARIDRLIVRLHVRRQGGALLGSRRRYRPLRHREAQWAAQRNRTPRHLSLLLVAVDVVAGVGVALGSIHFIRVAPIVVLVVLVWRGLLRQRRRLHPELFQQR